MKKLVEVKEKFNNGVKGFEEKHPKIVKGVKIVGCTTGIVLVGYALAKVVEHGKQNLILEVGEEAIVAATETATDIAVEAASEVLG